MFSLCSKLVHNDRLIGGEIDRPIAVKIPIVMNDRTIEVERSRSIEGYVLPFVREGRGRGEPSDRLP
jgi:hypothetical protein